MKQIIIGLVLAIAVSVVVPHAVEGEAVTYVAKETPVATTTEPAEQVTPKVTPVAVAQQLKVKEVKVQSKLPVAQTKITDGEKIEKLLDCIEQAESDNGRDIRNKNDGGSPSYGNFQVKEVFIKDYYRRIKEPMPTDWETIAFDREWSREIVKDSILRFNKFREFGYRTQRLCQQYR